MSKISVIVPIGGKRKMEALQSLQNQEEKVEIIVENGPNPSRNRNKGIKKSSKEIIAFVDAHSIMPKNWSRKIGIFFKQNEEYDIVGGPQLTPQDENLIGKASGYALSSIFGSAEVSARYSPNKSIKEANEKFLTSANLACRRRVFSKIKFDEKIYPGEDPKFIDDAKNAGFKIVYSPDIFVFHRRRQSIKELAKQIFNYGVARPKKESLGRTLKNPSFLVPALFVLYIPLFAIFSLFNFIFTLPLALYIILNIIFSVYEGIKNNDLASIFLLPFIFFTIHIMYGIGFIYGYIGRKHEK
ncbi:MAG: glycosyltransferase [Nanoarchaeota archaeon]